jgi:hypothetical protein
LENWKKEIKNELGLKIFSPLPLFFYITFADKDGVKTISSFIFLSFPMYAGVVIRDG